MYYYFYSTYNSVLKINGMYYGSISKCVKPIRIDDNLPPFVQACSLCSSEKDVNLLIDDDFLTCPPENVSLIDLNGGYALVLNSSNKKEGFFVLAQQKFPYAVITVFNENGLKISIETPNDFYALPLTIRADNATITPFILDGEQLFAINIKGDNNHLLIYKITNNIELLFFRQVHDFCIQNSLTTSEKFSDIAKHTVTTNWTLRNGFLVEKDRIVSKSENFSLDSLNENILPFAFLEQLFCGGDIVEFLSENIKENARLFNSFFGKFIGICPPPAFIEKDCVGVIYRIKNNIYKVKYFCFELQNGKISNIKEIE